MEHLTKQQIVLLTLFTSFVTSIATGIVTVALVDQAPTGVTSTINHVIERTIEEVGPSATTGSTQSASASNAATTLYSSPADQIAAATARGEQSMVRVMLGTTVTGIGIVMNSKGVIVVDKSSVATPGNYVAISSTGAQYPLQVIQTQNNGDFAFLLAGPVVTPGPASATTTVPSSLVPVSFASLAASPSGTNTLQLGETVIALSATGPSVDSTTVSEGIIQKINMNLNSNGVVDASSTISSFGTNIDSSNIAVGSPLFDSSGSIIGIKTLSNLSGNFYPIGYLESLAPTL